MKMAPCPATSGSWQVPEVLGDGGWGKALLSRRAFPQKCIFIGTSGFCETGEFCTQEVSENRRACRKTRGPGLYVSPDLRAIVKCPIISAKEQKYP